DVRGQDLDRDQAVEPRVARAIDLAHAARASGAENFVGTETGSGREGHMTPQVSSLCGRIPPKSLGETKRPRRGRIGACSFCSLLPSSSYPPASRRWRA